FSVWYQAAEVNVVLHPGDGRVTARVLVELDGEPVPPLRRGEDLRQVDGVTVVRVDLPRMYRLIRSESFEEHELVVRAQDAGLRAYALTFVSCVKPMP
ncbi:MAG: hypothetical protein C4290_10455, partial [Chloroflexota bacterium]